MGSGGVSRKVPSCQQRQNKNCTRRCTHRKQSSAKYPTWNSDLASFKRVSNRFCSLATIDSSLEPTDQTKTDMFNRSGGSEFIQKKNKHEAKNGSTKVGRRGGLIHHFLGVPPGRDEFLPPVGEYYALRSYRARRASFVPRTTRHHRPPLLLRHPHFCPVSIPCWKWSG